MEVLAPLRGSTNTSLMRGMERPATVLYMASTDTIMEGCLFWAVESWLFLAFSDIT
jgi:hypothetical protein